MGRKLRDWVKNPRITCNGKLNRKQVTEIYHHLKKQDVSQAKLAKRFHISQRTIRDIKTKRTWVHLTNYLDLTSKKSFQKIRVYRKGRN